VTSFALVITHGEGEAGIAPPAGGGGRRGGGESKAFRRRETLAALWSRGLVKGMQEVDRCSPVPGLIRR
jgi:hypothetical protein